MSKTKVARKGKDVASEVKQLTDDTNAATTAASKDLKKLRKRSSEAKEKGKPKERVVETPEDVEVRKAKLARLDELDNQIRTAQASFVVIADAVFEIATQVLWALREKSDGKPYQSPADYCAVNYAMSSADTTRYKNAGAVLEILRKGNCETLPTNESQARVLARIRKDEGDFNPSKIVNVWKKAMEENPTAERIREIAGLKAAPSSSSSVTIPKPKTFDQRSYSVSVVVNDEEIANNFVKQFRDHDGPKTHGKHWVASVGLDDPSELVSLLSESGSSDITIRLVKS